MIEKICKRGILKVVINMLKELRKEIGMTQKEAAVVTGIPLRTYINYELDASKKDSIKYKYIVDKLLDASRIDEEHGILSIEEIKDTVTDILSKYNVQYCYLFGSYAKGKAKDESDVDLLISTTVTGLKFFGLVEELRVELKKKVDLLTVSQIVNNEELLNEILKDGVKIYG